MTRPPLERYLNWVPEMPPTPLGDHGKENHPPVEEPRKVPRKMRPRRKKREHHHRPDTSGSPPGTSQSPNRAMSASVKHPQPPQLPQHPQHPHSAATHNSARPNLLDQAELSRLYKPASSRNPLPDLVETTSSGLTSPSIAHSDLIETTSLGRPVWQ